MSFSLWTLYSDPFDMLQSQRHSFRYTHKAHRKLEIHHEHLRKSTLHLKNIERYKNRYHLSSINIYITFYVYHWDIYVYTSSLDIKQVCMEIKLRPCFLQSDYQLFLVIISSVSGVMETHVPLIGNNLLETFWVIVSKALIICLSYGSLFQ
jgi:hypothetical protein